MIWVLIPLAVPVLLFMLHRAPFPPASPNGLGLAAACLALPVSALLVLRSLVMVFPSPARRAPLKVATILFVTAAALSLLTRSFIPLQSAFVFYFALFAAVAAFISTPPSARTFHHSSFIIHHFLDFLLLTKPGLTAMVLAPVLIGFLLSSPIPHFPGTAGVLARNPHIFFIPHSAFRIPHFFSSLLLPLTLLGVALLAGGAGAINQFLERSRDGRMARTALRPLPSGRLDPRAALRFGALLALAGMLLLALTVNLATAWLATFSFAIYVFLYTPLKGSSTLATLVGAVSGALPPLLGWFAAGGALTPAALTLFFILYLWQIPHFLAIVWKYRAQYRAAGFRLYGALDPTGRATGLQALLYAVALLPVSLMLTWHGAGGLRYLFGAFALGLALVVYAAAFARTPSPARARRLFIASIAYLPLLLWLMLLDRWM